MRIKISNNIFSRNINNLKVQNAIILQDTVECKVLFKGTVMRIQIEKLRIYNALGRKRKFLFFTWKISYNSSASICCFGFVNKPLHVMIIYQRHDKIYEIRTWTLFSKEPIASFCFKSSAIQKYTKSKQSHIFCDYFFFYIKVQKKIAL